jgi:hypothetical protein
MSSNTSDTNATALEEAPRNEETVTGVVSEDGSTSMDTSNRPDLQKNSTTNEQDEEMDGPGDNTKREELEDEYASLNSLQALYYYAVPKRRDNMANDERAALVERTIQNLILEDFAKYQISEAPLEIGAEAENQEQLAFAQLNWKAEKLHHAKRKVVYGYGLTGRDSNSSDVDFDDVIEELQTTEEEWGIDPNRRPLTMSDKQWSDEKGKMLEKARSDPVELKKMQERKEAEEKEDEADANKQAMIQERAQGAASSFSGMDKKLEAIRTEERPDGLMGLQRTMAMLILRWWASPPSKQDMLNCTAINTQVGLLPGGNTWKIVPTELQFWQTRLKNSLAECEKETTDQKLEEKLDTLALNAITFTNKLRKAGLDWKMVISKDTHRRIFTCLLKATSKEVKDYKDQLAKAYLEIRREQTEVLAASIVVVQMMHMNGTIIPGNLRMCLEQIKCLNALLGEKNLSIALPRTDHNIPTLELEEATKHFENNRPTEAKNSITKLLYKINALHIKGFEAIEVDYQTSTFSASEADKEVLDVVRPPDMLQNYDDIPLLKSSYCTRAYEGALIKTVGWGASRGSRFYINQYGIQTAPIWRKERYMSQEWANLYGRQDPPLELKVSASMNRLGGVRAQEKMAWDSRHIEGLYGVAFTDGGSKDPLHWIKPDTYKFGDGERWKSDYVLVGWDCDGNGIDVKKCWETRSTLRERWGSKDADIAIYNAAKESQDKFDKTIGVKSEVNETKGGESDFRDNLPGPLIKEEIKRLRLTSSGISHPSDNPPREVSKDIKTKRSVTRASTVAAKPSDVRGFLVKITKDEELSEKAIMAIMSAKFGELWINQM